MTCCLCGRGRKCILPASLPSIFFDAVVAETTGRTETVVGTHKRCPFCPRTTLDKRSSLEMTWLARYGQAQYTNDIDVLIFIHHRRRMKEERVLVDEQYTKATNAVKDAKSLLSDAPRHLQRLQVRASTLPVVSNTSALQQTERQAKQAQNQLHSQLRARVDEQALLAPVTVAGFEQAKAVRVRPLPARIFTHGNRPGGGSSQSVRFAAVHGSRGTIRREASGTPSTRCSDRRDSTRTRDPRCGAH